MYYIVDLEVQSNRKLPERVVLCGAPNGVQVAVPMDIGIRTDSDIFFTRRIDLGTTAPSIGDTYAILVTYTDGTSETVTPGVTSVVGSTPTLTSPIGTTSMTSPMFAWTSPGGIIYQELQLRDSNSTLWDVFPLDPSVGLLSYTGTLNAGTYSWSISVQDANGNAGQAQATFTVGP
jgi:hypothetical protein